jgi:hypothetical protein
VVELGNIVVIPVVLEVEQQVKGTLVEHML